MVPASPAAISFDFWNTLVPEPGGRLSALRREAVVRTLLEHQIELEEHVLDAHLAAAQALHEAHWTKQQHFTAEDAARYFVATVDGLDDSGRARVADSYLNAGEEAALELTSDAAETLEALDRAGVRLGIICDVGLTPSPHLRSFLDQTGVLDRFRGWAFSDEVGHFKPSRRSSPTCSPSSMSPRATRSGTSVICAAPTSRAPARAGRVPIRYRGLADDLSDAPDADFVIDDLSELLTLVRGPGHASR